MRYFLELGGVLFVYMSVWFVLSVWKKRNDVADVAWGVGFVLLSWVSFFRSDESSVRSLLVCSLVSVWGLRLAWHIHTRNKGRTEDYRYLAWRKEWGRWFYMRSYVQVYLLQGALLLLIVLPVLVINNHFGPVLGGLDMIGLAIWCFGFYFESVGDAQLARFIQNPVNKGSILQRGLWAYTRHPNYFGEVTQWWGIWLMTLSVPGAWWSVVGPLTITFLIVKVSGIPMLEKKMAENPAYAEYAKGVSMFIPLPPKKV